MMIHSPNASAAGPALLIRSPRIVRLAAAVRQRLLTDAREGRADSQRFRIDLEVDDRRLARRLGRRKSGRKIGGLLDPDAEAAERLRIGGEVRVSQFRRHDAPGEVTL